MRPDDPAASHIRKNESLKLGKLYETDTILMPH